MRKWQNTTEKSTSRTSVVRVLKDGVISARRSRNDGFAGGGRNAMKNGDSGVHGEDGVTMMDGSGDFSEAGRVISVHDEFAAWIQSISMIALTEWRRDERVVKVRWYTMNTRSCGRQRNSGLSAQPLPHLHTLSNHR